MLFHSLPFVQPCIIQARLFSSTSSCLFFNRGWRENFGLPRSGNEYGPLTDLPDWSYMDGRPGPLGLKQHYRFQKRIQLAKEIEQLLNEVDSAVESNEQHKTEEEQKRQDIIKKKLKPKGQKLLDLGE